MILRFKLFNAFLGFIFLLAINPFFILKVNAEESFKIELKKELKKGNFLIGLKQYLGGRKDSFSKNNNITFTSDNVFLNLKAANGIQHKSKKITIAWKVLPIKSSYTLERLVFGPFASFESAQKHARKLKENGYEANIAFPKNWEVWIPYTDTLSNNEFKYKKFKKIYETQITPFLINEYTSQKLDGPIYISSNEEIKINNINYGNKFYLAQDLYGTWTLIQKIKFDDYLEGVLPYEIGSNSPLEALKAQAVIARTWAIHNSERFNMDKYHLCITTQCQVYKPTKALNKKVKKAIKDTSNLIITYKNKPINSFYHGSNGGISAAASESWKIDNYPYLRIKIDGPNSLNKSLKFITFNKFQLNEFFNYENKEFFGSNHSLFRWEKKISSSIILDNLIAKKLIDKIEDKVDLNVLERGLSGRVIKLKIKLENSKKSIVLEKDDIRRILSFLPSNLFTINKLNDDLWLFRGGGFGHGVGLSQSGAIEMAELGFTYQQILNHYYQGTKIKNIEILFQ